MFWKSRVLGSNTLLPSTDSGFVLGGPEFDSPRLVNSYLVTCYYRCYVDYFFIFSSSHVTHTLQALKPPLKKKIIVSLLSELKVWPVKIPTIEPNYVICWVVENYVIFRFRRKMATRPFILLWGRKTSKCANFWCIPGQKRIQKMYVFSVFLFPFFIWV